MDYRKLFYMMLENNLTVQVGRLDGTIVVTSNNDDGVYVSERYDDQSKGQAACKAISRAVWMYQQRRRDRGQI